MPTFADPRLEALLEHRRGAELLQYAVRGRPVRQQNRGSNPELRADAGILRGLGGRHGVLAVFCGALPHGDWGVDNPRLLAIASRLRADGRP